MAHWDTRIAVIIASLFVSCSLISHGALLEPPGQKEALARIGQLAREGRWNDIQTSARAWLKDHPSDDAMLYNLACAQSRLGDQRAASDSLRQALRAGFDQWGLMQSDADLDGLRTHEAWESVLAVRDSLRNTSRTGEAQNGGSSVDRASEAMTRWRERHGASGYRYESDEVRRLHIISSLDETSDREMKASVRAQADHLIEALFESPQPDYVLIVIPTREDAKQYLEMSDDPTEPSQGGVYDHNKRALISQDIGASLRHEFVHAMHWGHMDRLGQRHPVWLQEGLAALYESYDIDDSGRVRYRANERHNIVWDAINRKVAPTFAELFAMDNDTFVRPDIVLVNYAQVRSIFEHLASQRKVEAFYKEYVKLFAEDPTGQRALETVWGKPLDQVESGWRKWILRRGQIDDSVGRGDASLGIAAEDAGDGARLITIAEGGPAKAAGMQLGDVIVSLGTRPVRSMLELQLDLARRKVGEKVEVRFRRGDSYLTLRVTLTPLGGRRSTR
ncbi:MAG: PDZ domain-containing protein [Planctomycetota bacterium]|nr:PDZ domain-containing protein [Planctomycetota bacterium]